MIFLRQGSTGALVALLQKGLQRASFSPGAADGVFGPRTRAALTAFQREAGLAPDGVAGPLTQAALERWYTGFVTHTVAGGDTLWRISRRYGTALRALETANPGLDPFDLRPGQRLTVPLPFDVVPTDILWGSALAAYCVRGLTARYPFLRSGILGRSVLGAPLWWLGVGGGPRRVLYNAAHHANEWLTVPLLFRYLEELCAAAAFGERIFGRDAGALLERAEILLVPLVNPDGVDLVNGALPEADAARAAALAAAYPGIPFPSGWKANIRGIDLNLQYPAGWENAREIKFAQGYTRPGPRDYVGGAPLEAPESRALHAFTEEWDPALVLAYHAQGRVIYWKYLDMEPPGSLALVRRFAEVSGYTYEDTPMASGYAGYKDWFILSRNLPGFTVEVGSGDVPLPLEQFAQIYAENVGILTLAAEG